MLRLFFLIAHAGIAVAHARGHRLGKYLFQGVHDLSGGIAFRRRDVELGTVEHILADQEFRGPSVRDVDDGVQRNRVSVVVAHVEHGKLVDAVPVGGVRLHVHLPFLAVDVEVVQEGTPHVRLDGGINLIHVHVLEGGLFRIDIQIVLKVGRRHEVADARNFRSFPGRLDEFGRIGGQEFLAYALAVFQQEGDVPGRAHSREGGGRNHVGHAGGN